MTSPKDEIDVDMDDRPKDMILDIGEYYFRKACVYDTLCSDKNDLLYKGCINFTQ